MHLTQFVALFDCLSEDYLLLQKVVDTFTVFLKRQALGQEKSIIFSPGGGGWRGIINQIGTKE